jgi:hypothetical protein
MKELLRGVLSSILSLVVFTPVIVIGILFNIFYPTYMGFKEKSWKLPFKLYWRLIDGTCTTIGNMLYDGVAIKWDEMGNVWGEWIEDSVTTTENSKFGEKDITISASVGYLEYEKLPLFPRGKKLSKVLNWAFRENKHALGSWEKKLAYDEIDAKNLKGSKGDSIIG